MAVGNGVDASWDQQQHLSPGVHSVDPKFLPMQPDPDTDWCPLPILHHEPYNTWESWHVWNFTSALLQRGAAFCDSTSERSALIARWRARLDEVCGSATYGLI